MIRRIIDTNVAVVAEGLSDQADRACRDACEDVLLQIMKEGRIVIDSDDAIVHEYVSALGHAGQPGIGRAFVKWAFDQRFDPTKCEQTPITPLDPPSWRLYAEIPDVPPLRGFDRSDQKFLAVAIASNPNAAISNAVDSDWWHFKEAIEAAGITIDFVCPQHRPQ